MVVDMTPVTRSDSSGAHFIYDLGRDLKARGIQLVLCDPTDTVGFNLLGAAAPQASSDDCQSHCGRSHAVSETQRGRRRRCFEPLHLAPSTLLWLLAGHHSRPSQPLRPAVRACPCCLPPCFCPVSAPQIVRMLERINIYEVVPRKWVFVHTYDGVRAAMAGLDDGENGFSASATGKAAPAVLNKDVDHAQ